MNFVSIVLGLIGGFLGMNFKGTATSTGSSTSNSRGYNPP
jgi:hypothetical protein